MQASTVPNTCLYAIGDIHGRMDLLQQLQEKIVVDAKKYPGHQLKFICLGDFIDRGSGTKQIIDSFIHAPLPGFEAIYLKGNHEDMLLNFMNDADEGPIWLLNGGFATLFSYDVEFDTMLNPSQLQQIQKDLLQKMPDDHQQFLQALKVFHTEGDYFFCHAGVRPGIPLEAQNEVDMTWIREEFLNSDADFGKVVIHGHTVSLEPQVRHNRIGIDTGAAHTGTLTCVVLHDKEHYFLTSN